MKKVKGAGFRILIILGMLLPVVLVSGCSHEVYQNGIPDYSSGKGHSPDITKRDLDRFASSIKPLNSQVAPFYRRAIHFQKRGKHNLAITELKKALQADPGSAKVYNAMGISYDHLRLYDRAIVCYQKALALEPDLAYTYNNLGYSYMLSNDLNSAIKAFEKAIALDGSKPRYRNNLGLAYVMNGQNDKAYEQFAIVKDETGADEKIAKLMYRMGKVKVNQYLAKKSDTATTETPSVDNHPVVSEIKNSSTESTTTTAITDSPNPEELQYPEENYPANPPDNSSKDQMIAREKVPPDAHQEDDAAPAPETEVEQPTIVVAKAKPVQQELEIETQPKKYASESDTPIYFLSVVEPSFESDSELKHNAEKEKVGEHPTPELNEEQRKPLVTAEAPSPVVSPPAMKAGEQKSPQAESQVKAKSVLAAKKEVSKVDPKPADAKVEIEIEVANGNGQQGAARKLGNYLSGKGFKVVKVTNARSFDHTTSKIFYCDVNIEEVYQLIQTMPIDKRRRNLIKLNHLGNRIKIIVGHDLI